MKKTNLPEIFTTKAKISGAKVEKNLKPVLFKFFYF